MAEENKLRRELPEGHGVDTAVVTLDQPVALIYVDSATGLVFMNFRADLDEITESLVWDAIAEKKIMAVLDRIQGWTFIPPKEKDASASAS